LLGGDAPYERIQFLIDLGVLDRGTYQAELDRFYDDYGASWGLRAWTGLEARAADGWIMGAM
jgi:hypothetical protein